MSAENKENTEILQLKFDDFQKWLISLQVVNHYFDKIYVPLRKHYNESTISDYAAIEEEICKRTMGDFKKQKAAFKKLKDLKAAERNIVHTTNKNLVGLRQTARDLTNKLSMLNEGNATFSTELMIKYLDENIKL